MGFISNGKNRSISNPAGTVPDVSGAIADYYQPLVFDRIVKETVNFEVVETTTPFKFIGAIMPFTARQLLLKPEGQRAWSWFLVYSQIQLPLKVDDVIIYEGRQTRVMGSNAYNRYGYWEYHVVQDWKGAGPKVAP